MFALMILISVSTLMGGVSVIAKNEVMWRSSIGGDLDVFWIATLHCVSLAMTKNYPYDC